MFLMCFLLFGQALKTHFPTFQIVIFVFMVEKKESAGAAGTWALSKQNH